MPDGLCAAVIVPTVYLGSWSAGAHSAYAPLSHLYCLQDEMRVSNTGAPLPLQQQPSSSNQDVESG
jgi:hypothetical protein